MQENHSLVQMLPHPLFEKAGIEVKLLRLDRLHPVISGNKWMKLLPWLNLAKHGQYSGFLTKGGPFSNHIHAAAYTALLHHTTCTVVVKAKTGMLTPTLQDVLQWNATVVYAPDDYDNDEKWQSLALAGNQLFIPTGGEGSLAAEGVAHFVNALNLPPADCLVCSVGTGTTLSGLAGTGLFKKRIIGINPGINDEFAELKVELYNKAPGKEIIISRDASLKKFGKWPLFLPPLMNEWYSRWQVPTDIVYTAKMFRMFFNMVEQQQLNEGETCMLVHTGGLQGNRSLPKGLLNYEGADFINKPL